MSYLDRIHACNRWNPADFVPFLLAGEPLGRVRRSFALGISGLGDFRLDGAGLHWVSAPPDCKRRTATLRHICEDLIARGWMEYLHGEQYPLTPDRREDARCLIDRAAAPYFGARAHGQHLNGFVRRADGIHLWIGRRAADRRVEPNKLDNMVAGGLPFGIALADNLRKECWEEAQIPPQIATRAIPVGAVSYCRDSEQGLKPDVMYCYDLELSTDCVPRCNDGEVAAFELMPIASVMALVRDTDEFKLNCNLVIIDFLIRHGLIGPEEPDYLDLVAGLRLPIAPTRSTSGGSTRENPMPSANERQ